MKDPAVLFYFQDFLVGTELMAYDEVGMYIRILCHLADKKMLNMAQLRYVCRGDVPVSVMAKLQKDNNGNYYQHRMQEEREKRIKHCEHQKENINKRWNKNKEVGNTTVLPLENVNENVNVIKDIINISFIVFWDLYDKKRDKIKCEGKWNRLTNKERQECIDKIPEYIESTPDKQFRKDPETFLNNKSWNDEIIKPTVGRILVSTVDPYIKNKYKMKDE